MRITHPHFVSSNLSPPPQAASLPIKMRAPPLLCRPSAPFQTPQPATPSGATPPTTSPLPALPHPWPTGPARGGRCATSDRTGIRCVPILTLLFPHNHSGWTTQHIPTIYPVAEPPCFASSTRPHMNNPREAHGPTRANDTRQGPAHPICRPPRTTPYSRHRPRTSTTHPRLLRRQGRPATARPRQPMYLDFCRERWAIDCIHQIT